jgi:hypothetical protein
MRPRRLSSRELALLAGLTVASFMGFAGCATPSSRAISVLDSVLATNQDRLSAIRQLQASGKQAVLEAKPELIDLLGSFAPDVQRGAEEALTLVGPDVASDLVKRSEGAHKTVGQLASRAGVLRILRQTSVDNAVIEQVVASTKSSDFAERLNATELLGALSVRNSLALAHLGQLISDENPLIRIAAINEATDIGASSGATLVPALIGALDDRTIAVREAACIGLGTIGPSAIQAKSSLQRLTRERDTRMAKLAQIALANVTQTDSFRPKGP